MQQILLANATLLDGTTSELRQDMDVLVEMDRIREVSDVAIKSSSARVIDLQGKTLMPGLSDGPRVFFSGRALSQTGGHGDARPRTWEADTCVCQMRGAPSSVIADGVPEVQKAARQELRRGAMQIKIMGSGGVASPHDPVWNRQYSEAETRVFHACPGSASVRDHSQCHHGER